jgi:hypothetical protein
MVRVGNNTSTTLILNTGAAQGCVLSPILYSFSLMTAQPGMTPTPSLSLLMTQQSDHSLNVIKTKEMIVDYRKRRTEHAPILINGAVVEQVESIKFHGVHIINKLSWSMHTKTAVKRARQNQFPLRRLKIFGMGPQILKRFYSCTIESIWTGCITTWYGNCSASDRKALQRVVRTAQYITGDKLPAIQDLNTRQCQRKAHKIVRLQSNSPCLSLYSSSLCFHTASGTGAPILGPKGSSTASTPKP